MKRACACAMAAALLCPTAAFATAKPISRPLNDGDQIAKALTDGCKAVEAKDAAGMMAPFEKSDTLTMFDFGTPRSRNWEQLHAADEEFAKTASGGPFCQYLEIHPVILSPDAAYSWAIMRAGGTTKDGKTIDFTIRSTDIWRKMNGSWKIVHEHNSFPTDMATGKADLQSRP